MRIKGIFYLRSRGKIKHAEATLTKKHKAYILLYSYIEHIIFLGQKKEGK